MDIHGVAELLKFHLLLMILAFCFHREGHVIVEIVNQELKQVNNWSSANKLSSNVLNSGLLVSVLLLVFHPLPPHHTTTPEKMKINTQINGLNIPLKTWLNI